MTLFRNPLAATQAILISLVPLTFITFAFPLFVTSSDDRWLNNISGAVALLGAALALCRVWSEESDQRACLFWLVAAIGFSVLAISQWYENRLQLVEHRLHIDDIGDILLMVVMPPILAIGLRSKGVSRIVKTILLLGFLAQAISIGVDLLDDWAALSLPGGARTAAMAVDYAELIFLQLYVVAFALFAASDLTDLRRRGPSEPRARDRRA